MIEIILILIYVITDSLRDKLFGMVNWWLWHIIKWIEFYLPIFYIIYKTNFSIRFWIIFTIICTIVWITIYRW